MFVKTVDVVARLFVILRYGVPSCLLFVLDDGVAIRRVGGERPGFVAIKFRLRLLGYSVHWTRLALQRTTQAKKHGVRVIHLPH